MKRLNLYNFIAGFLTVNVINHLTYIGINIDSYQYRVFSVLLSLFVLIFLFFKNFNVLKIVFRNQSFKFYLIFSLIYIIRLFVDLFFSEVNLPGSSSAVLEMMISISYILIIPLSLISILTIDLSKFFKQLFFLYSASFVIDILFNPVIPNAVYQRLSILDNIGVQNFGLFASILLIWSIILLFSSISIFYKFILIPLICISLYFVGLSGTRSVFLAFIVIILLFIFQNKEFILSKKVLIIILFITVLITLIFLRTSWLNLTLLRFQYGFETGSTGRQGIWDEAIRMFFDSPIIGNYHIIPNSAYFHNFFLDAFVSTGLFGGLLFALLNFKILKICLYWLKLSSNDEFRFFSILYLLIFTYGMFSSNLYSNPLYWGSLVIIISLSAYKPNQNIHYEINN